MVYRVYGNLMRPCWQEQPPTQPDPTDTLVYAAKPALHPIPPSKCAGARFCLISTSLEQICPRKHIDNLQTHNLQIWLHHLGLALYNPVTAVLHDGTLSFPDGDHRTRCLWETGEPEVHVMLVQLAEDTDFAWHNAFRRWKRRVIAKNHQPRAKQKAWNLYPSLYPPAPILESFFGSRHDPKSRFKRWVDQDVSFSDVVDAERVNIFRHMNNHATFQGKTVLDVGASFGYYSYLAVEAGATRVYAVDPVRRKVQVIRKMTRRRAVLKRRLSATNLPIHRFLQRHTAPFDTVLLLNVLHHLLRQDAEEGWRTLNHLLTRCSTLFLMCGVTWKVLEQWHNNVLDALRDRLTVNCTVTPLYQSSYRNRMLYALEPT